MSITVEIGDAAGLLPDLLAKVEAGEEVILARGENPVIRMSKVDPKTQVRAAIEAMREIRRKLPKTTIEEIVAWKDEDSR